VRNALSIVETVLTIDPAYGDAWATKAQIFKTLAGVHSRRAAEWRVGYANAAEYARQAIRIAPRSRLGYWALATIFDEQLNRRAAFDMYRRMQMLPGSDATTLQSYAWHLSEIGRGAEALKLADETILLDPLNPLSYSTKAVALGNVRRFAEAIEFTQRAENLAPERLGPRRGQAHFRLLLGDVAGARTILATLPPDDISRLTDEAVIAARTGNRAESVRLLQRLRQVSSDSGYYQQAQVLTQQGKLDEAILTLEKAWSARDPGLTFLLVDPMLDPLRHDPRFQVILKRLNLP
jgi:tetratricopeptide (TPR) repeat protein